jgi:uncharacterized RDD family membrane protein YckC
MTMIAMIFFIPMMIKGFSSAFNISHEQTETDFGGPLLYVSLVGFVLYFCKDIINGRSIGKRITKTQVVDNVTGQVASPLKCFVRNILCVIWPVEVIVTLINPSRRLGDQIAGTKIVPFDAATTEQPKFDIKKGLVPLVIAYGLMLLLMLPFQALKPSFTKVKYIESSYNENESKSLEKLFADSLGQNLSASVKVFNKIENQNTKYISIIYTLKENYLEDEGQSRQLKRITNEVLYSQHPRETFTGQAKYVYKANGIMQTSSNQIGTSIHNDKK